MHFLELAMAYQCYMPPQFLYVNAFWIIIYMTCGFVLKLIMDIHLDCKCINNKELGGMYFQGCYFHVFAPSAVLCSLINIQVG